MDVPEFVDVKFDEENRSAILSVQDTEIKEQKEMWGVYFSYPFTSPSIFEAQETDENTS